MQKRDPIPPQIQVNGLYWEAERRIAEAMAELAFLTKERQRLIQSIEDREGILFDALEKALAMRDELKPKEPQ